MLSEKEQKLKELKDSYYQALEVTDRLREQWQALSNEIAADKARFPVGSVIVFNKEKMVKISGSNPWNAKYRREAYQEKYKVTRITNDYVYANRIKKDGSEGAEKKLYSWDVKQAELSETSK